MPFDPSPIRLHLDEDRDFRPPPMPPLFPAKPVEPIREERPIESSFWAFVEWAWPIMRPGLIITDPQYLEAICLHLEVITDPSLLARRIGWQGSPEDLRIRHLLLAIEPRSGKSDILAMWAAWEWGPRRMPWLRHLVGIHRTDALEECHEALMRLILSQQYQELYGDVVQRGRLWSWDRLNLSAGGGRQLVSKRMTIQGLPAHRLIPDDLIGDLEVDRLSARRRAMRFLNGSFRSRGLEKLATPTVVTHQRLHPDDPIGRLEAEEGLASKRHEDTGYKGTWDRLVFQTEFAGPVSDTALTRAMLWRDGRRQGQPLRAAWTDEMLARAKRRPEIWWPQHQQAPRSGQDAIWKRHWWRFWHYPGQPRFPVTVRLPDGTERDVPCEPLPKRFERQIQSWDLAFGKTATSSKVAGSVWGQTGSSFYWLHCRAERRTFLESLQAIIETSAEWPQTSKKLIEAKANGVAAEDMLRSKIPGIELVEPQGSKAARAGVAADYLSAGNCWLPHPSIAPWVGDFLDFMDTWTGEDIEGTDELDTASQAIIWLAKHANRGHDQFEIADLSPWRQGPKQQNFEDDTDRPWDR